MKRLSSLLSEPLLHFLALGVLLFVLFNTLNPTPIDDPRNIQVKRDGLLTFMQHRAKTFDPQSFAEQLDALPPEQLQPLVQAYIREEALYREAKALSLDRNDYLARQRLIQQLTYITRGFIDAGTQLSESELAYYLAANQARYREPGKITFTHVYFSFDRLPKDEALARARAALHTLNQQTVPFHQSGEYGERFLYHRNYVQKEADLVASHFGTAMQTELFLLPVDGSLWQGPLVSHYGAHLVLVSGQSQAYDPPLEDVIGRVQQDALQARIQAQLEEAISAIVSTYEVDMAPALAQKLKAAG